MLQGMSLPPKIIVLNDNTLNYRKVRDLLKDKNIIVNVSNCTRYKVCDIRHKLKSYVKSNKNSIYYKNLID